MEYLNKTLVKSYVTQAMLTFALERLSDINASTNDIAEEFTNKILEELK